ncbi:MAG: T9SS type A sorting domain-containing protein [Bacteroidales bacterium]|nr:T9SS type A sorting domain-containing protein [Bacteroidales bacterium]
MKRITGILLFVISAVCVCAQQNVNPDPNAEAWIAGGLRPLTEHDIQMIENTPKLVRSEASQRMLIPTRVDNTEQMFFPPVFNQEGGSCGQASGVGYTFSYEINRIRNLSGDEIQNQYPSHFTWNFLNGGSGGGSWYFDGWQITKTNGCPNVEEYGGYFASGGDTRWMSGYDEYYSGMNNRVYEVFTIDVSTEEGINTLRQWFFDHLDGSETGGIANFAAGVSETFETSYVPSGTPHSGESIVTWWDESVNHAMTFVGYDDEICWDFNNDGEYTNDVDLNDDGIIDPRDWEIGAVIMVNSWGNWWCDGGKAYVPYKLLGENQQNGGIWNSLIHTITVKPECQPLLTLKTTINHNSRNKLKITAGVSADPQAETPDHVMNFPLFNYQGGDFYMQGGYDESDKTLELGLDVTPLLSEVENGETAKFFLYVVENDPDNIGTGEVNNFSLIDHNSNEEIVYPEENIALLENDTTILGLVKEVSFDKVEIISSSLDIANQNLEYSNTLLADGGTEPYKWAIKIDYSETVQTGSIPAITQEQLTPTDNDDGYATKELEFEFPFYGQFYNQLIVSTDGSLIFGGEFEYIRSESNLMQNKAITPYGSDLMIYPDQGDGIWYEGNETFAAFRWKTSKFDQPEFDIEAAVKIYATGEIEFFYGTIDQTNEWVSGVSMGDQTSYTIASYSGNASIPNNLSSSYSGGSFPRGMNISEDGVFHGTPIETGTWNLNFRVRDYDNIYSERELNFIVDYQTKIDQAKEATSFCIFPNPVVNILNIQLNDISPDEITAINVVDMNGKFIYQLPKPHVRSKSISLNDFNGKNLKAGIYTVQIKTKTAIINQRIIVL